MKNKPEFQDITAPENLEIQIRHDSKVIWINIDGVCVFRACRIQNLILTDNRSPSRIVVDSLKKQFIPFNLEAKATPHNDKSNTKSTTPK